MIRFNKLINIIVHFSVYNKSLVIDINGFLHDISNLVSNKIWNIGGSNILNTRPNIDWKIRCELSKITRKYIKNIYPDFPENKIIF